ncbi:MAG: DNA-deoxyinosine glycosylase [Methylovulum sp.]|nr:DNA-deoxyinosine glycosylase [Methylovulum sp.]
MVNGLSDSNGFAPIVSQQAKALILGTMPSVASLLKQQYYGHPRNAFWPIMAALFGADIEFDYQQRKEILIGNGIAVWDVLQYCRRPGSLDANIDMTSIKINDFEYFFAHYPLITRLFFNGSTAEKMYRCHVLSELNNRFPYLEYRRLPSTSPAYASLGLAQKIEAWQVIKESMIK